MSLAPVTQVSGRAVYIPGADIDTDRIIPARFMKCITFDGLGEFAFYDVRFDEHGQPTAHPLNDPRFAGIPMCLETEPGPEMKDIAADLKQLHDLLKTAN